MTASRSTVLVLFAALASASCGSHAPDGIEVTLEFDSSVNEAALASITSLHLVTSGESYDHIVSLDRSLGRVERFLYEPSSTSRSIEIALTAENASNALVAAGDTGLLAVAPGTSQRVVVTMHSDEGADAGVPDLTEYDATSPRDLEASLPYAQAVLADHPIAYYRLDETSGAIAKDSSSAGLNGSYFGSVALGAVGALAGDPDTAISETTSPAGVTVDSASLNFVGMNPFTLELWVKPTAVSSGQSLWMLNNDYYDTTNGRQDYNLFVDDSRVVHFERWVNGSISAIGTPPLSLGVYTYIVAVYDGAQLVLYSNGKTTSSNPDAHSAAAQNSRLVIGSADTSGGAFNGSIDEVAVYDHALSAAQVATHYAAGVTR